MIVDIVSSIPTPHGQAFFRALSQHVDLRVHFQGQPDGVRGWERIGSKFRDGYENVVHPGIRFHYLGWWSPGIRRALRRNADIVVLGGSYYSPTVTSLLLMKNRGHALYGYWGEMPTLNRLRRPILRTILSKLDYFLAIGERAAVRYRGLASCPVHVLPYSIDPGDLCTLGSPGRVGYIGQLVPRKGVDLLLEAAEGLDLRIDVIGTGPAQASLRALAEKLGVDVTWHGEQPNDALPGLRAAWCCQVVPSRYDGWGVVVNEALSSSTPVVVSDAAGAAEVVRHGVNGWVHRSEDLGSLRAALEMGVRQGRSVAVRRAAADTGHAFSTTSAAPFLKSLLENPFVERSFICEQWEKAVATMSTPHPPGPA